MHVAFHDTYQRLITPVTVGKRSAPNRFFAHPMESNTALPNGAPSSDTVRRYLDLAEGGWGSISVECTSVVTDDRPLRPQLALTDETIDSFAAMMDALRRENPDALYYIQLSHNASHSGVESGRMCSPAPSPDPNCRLMSRDEILRVRDASIRSAVLARKAGFDGVDIKQCHGFFGADILAPRNTREDEYGGAFENRTRFAREVFEGIRTQVPDLLLASRISIYEDKPGGFGTTGPGKRTQDMSEPMQLLTLMTELGIRVVSVSGPALPGWPEEYSTRPDAEEKLYRALRLPGIVKRALAGTGVLTVNSGMSVMGEDWIHAGGFCLANGLADFLGFGRQSLADPLLPLKLAEGQHINACRQRRGCWDHFTAAEAIRCEEYPRPRRPRSNASNTRP